MHQITIDGIRWGYLNVTKIVALRPEAATLEIHLSSGEMLVCDTGRFSAHDLADLIYNRMMGAGGPHIHLQVDSQEKRCD